MNRVTKGILALAALAVLTLAPATSASADAWGQQNATYSNASRSNQLVTMTHSISGKGRTANLQSATATTGKICGGRVDFTERTSTSALVKRSTGSTVSGCNISFLPRERSNITFASNTATACASLFDTSVLRVTQCHYIS